MDIKTYADKAIQAGWEAKGITLDEVKKELKRTMRVMAGLESTAVTTDPTTDVSNLEERIEAIEIQIEEWKETM